MKKSFSDRLTPGQIQHILDALNLPWREFYNPENKGWVNIPYGHEYHGFNSDLSVNIYHGGFVDQYLSGHPEPTMGDYPVRGDIVSLVTWLMFESDDYAKGIKWIQDVLGIKKGVKPPELEGGFSFAKDVINDDKYVRLPKSLLRSNLSASEKLIWSMIFDRCGKDEIYSFAGMRRICIDTGLAMGTVQKAIKRLKKYGLIIEKPRGRNANKAPARFPLVASMSVINERIEQLSKSRVLKNEHPCSNNELPCSNYRTELDLLTIPKELNPHSDKGKLHEPVIPSIFFYLAFQESRRRYEACLERMISVNDLTTRIALA